MYIVGLTGGIGSGKSVITNLFAQKGIDIVDADIAARVVVDRGKPALSKIAKHFGKDIIDQAGNLKRSDLRQLIFEDDSERAWLEQLLHPLIRAKIQSQLTRCKSLYSILASPLLIEARQHELVQRILVIDAPEELQLKRSMLRDGSDKGQIQAIMATQATRKQRLSSADDVICNDGSIEALEPIVQELHEKYLSLAQELRA